MPHFVLNLLRIVSGALFAQHGAQKLFSALRPLIQSIDSQIHETLLPFLNIFAFATPDPPPALAASTP